LLLNSDFLLNFQKFFVSSFELVSGLGSSLHSLEVSELFSFELFLNLLLDELTLKLFFLHLLNVVKFEIVKLVVNIGGILHFLVVFFFMFLS